MPTAEYWKKALNLQPHPEGGWFRESYRSSGVIAASGLPTYFGSRNFATSIYFLLDKEEFSTFHKLKSDEVWHYYDGCALNLHIIQTDGTLITKALGRDIEAGESLQQVVPANHWFAAKPSDKRSFSLAGCAMAPGFDLKDFEMAVADDLIGQFPQQAEIIRALTKS